MNSRIERAASCGLTTTPRALVATSATGAKLDTGSKGSDLLRAGVVPNEVATNSSVWPSGALFPTDSAPMLPVEPALLSVTTGTFQRSPSFGPSSRDWAALPVLGVKDTLLCLRRDGWTGATPGTAQASSSRASG